MTPLFLTLHIQPSPIFFSSSLKIYPESEHFSPATNIKTCVKLISLFLPFFYYFIVSISLVQSCLCFISLANFSSIFSPIQVFIKLPSLSLGMLFFCTPSSFSYMSNLKDSIWTWIILTSMVIFCLLYQAVCIYVLAPTIFLKPFSIVFLNA